MPATKSIWSRLFKWGLILGLLCGILVAAAVTLIYLKLAPNLPSIESLSHVQFQVPLRVYTQEEELIAEFGEKRREPVKIERVPDVLKQAFLASEDDRFYSHPGVDYQGLIRAFVHLVRTGRRGQGGSTITMQVARNFFLSNKKTYERKINEILLALQIESELEKDQILELYLNKIYLGNRAYGVGAASRVYYGKDVSELTLPEAAMIAGLPKAPSRYNPIVNPSRALLRRDYVLRRMHELKYITAQEREEASSQPATATLHFSQPEVEASYVAEMVRSRLHTLYGNRIYTEGLRVYTTLKSKNQQGANVAMRHGLIAYEKRHGFTGAIGDMKAHLEEGIEAEGKANELVKRLSSYREYGGLKAAVVLTVGNVTASVLLSNASTASISMEESLWARKRIDKKRVGKEITKLTEVLSVGDVVYVEHTDNEEVVLLSQMPDVEGALVSMEPKTGALLALVGGFDFHKSKFNRVVQARRQPGSNFKPFIYSTALNNGDTAASIYNDAPVVFHDSALEGEWRPENYSGRFFGPTRLREALVKSRNLVSIRILRNLGLRKSLDYVKRFGFDVNQLPPDLSLALGSGSVTPLQLVGAYSIFANSGYATPTHFIQRIEDARGETLFLTPKVTLCDKDCSGKSKLVEDVLPVFDLGAVDDASMLTWVGSGEYSILEGEEILPIQSGEYYLERVMDQRNAYIITSILKEVITRGTGRRAKSLKRRDLAGKTGTTNDQHDAWFSGFNSQIATSVWVGFDELQPLGAKETGGRAALPMWIDYMKVALEDVEEDQFLQPNGLVMVRIDKATGEPAKRGSESVMEIFRKEYAPIRTRNNTSNQKGSKRAPKNRQPAVQKPIEQLF